MTEPIDKSTWGDGPWQSEPDRDVWQDFRTKLECGVFRTADTGTWCGYVFLPPTHPLYGMTRADIKQLDIYVHGGVTWLKHAAGLFDRPASVGPDWQGVGFHCAHGDDYMPAMMAMLTFRRYADTYRDYPYARANVRLLAHQLAESTQQKQ